MSDALPEHQAPRSVAVVILNCNGLEDTLACLESLACLDSSGLRLSILVLDNASALDPRTAIAARFPRVELIRAERNLGFAAGCNLGTWHALAAGAEYVLLLNNDTRVAPDFLRRLVAYCEQHHAAGLVGPLICHGDRPDTVQSAGGRIALACGQGQHRGDGRPRARLPAHPFAVDYLSGACLLIPAPTARRVGLFDEGYFAYFEDVDLSLRTRQAGLAVVCVPEAVIWHHESASTRRGLGEGTTSPMKHYLIARNRTLTVRKHGRPWEQAIYFVVVLPALAAFFLLALTARRRWKKVVWFTLGLLDGVLGRGGSAGPEARGSG